MNNKDEKKLNVGIFVDTFFPMLDGVIMVVDNYAKRLSQKCNVTIFTLKPRGYKKGQDNYPYKVVRCARAILPFLDYDLPLPRLDRHFLSELKATELDIIHIHSPFTIGKLGIEFAKKNNIPVIATLHSQYKMDFYRNTKNKRLADVLTNKVAKTFNKCNECYTVNRSMAKMFHEEYGIDHVPLVQPNGTEMKPIDNKEAAIKMINEKFGLPDDMPVFLFVGRINKLKNIYFLLDALTHLKDKHFKMIFVGDGQDLHDFQNKVNSSSVANNVIFTGKLEDRDLLAALYLRAKLFLFPSLYDTNSLVQIEAASQNTPTLFLKESITSSTVTDNVNGFLSDATPEAYARKIEEILADDELYSCVSEAAFNDLYANWDQIVSDMYDKYCNHVTTHRQQNKI